MKALDVRCFCKEINKELNERRTIAWKTFYITDTIEIFIALYGVSGYIELKYNIKEGCFTKDAAKKVLNDIEKEIKKKLEDNDIDHDGTIWYCTYCKRRTTQFILKNYALPARELKCQCKKGHLGEYIRLKPYPN